MSGVMSGVNVADAVSTASQDFFENKKEKKIKASGEVFMTWQLNTLHMAGPGRDAPPPSRVTFLRPQHIPR